MAIKKVLVVGSGTMGSGIAQVCAQGGIQVDLNDTETRHLDKALQNVAWSVRKLVEKGKLEEDQVTIMRRIRAVPELEDVSDAEIVIEAVYENADVKKKLFAQVDKIFPPQTIIASNTSAIPITELAAATARPGKVVGLHFFNPVPLMQVVEVVRGTETTQETLNRCREFVLQIKKEALIVNRDVAGFIINRINYPAMIEAMQLVEQGVATIEDIDIGLKLGSGRKMGIFETGDMVGLDVTYGGLMAMYKETGDPKWFPPLLLRRKVKAGHLGRKCGKGWYEYNAEGDRKSP